MQATHKNAKTANFGMFHGQDLFEVTILMLRALFLLRIEEILRSYCEANAIRVVEGGS